MKPSGHDAPTVHSGVLRLVNTPDRDVSNLVAAARAKLDTAVLVDTTVVAALFERSTWSIYDAVKAGTFPIEPIRVGRRISWRASDLRQLLGLGPAPAAALPGGAG
ncbi:MAG: hypothetical protein JWN95_292 [Frankiales bacterium]|nr:hypothetical protein [Frankiales bacterium]